MAQDRPDDDATSVFGPGSSSSGDGDRVSLDKPSGTPDSTAQPSSGYDPTSWSQPNSQPSAQSGAQPTSYAQPNPYGQSWDPNAQQAGAQNPYAQNQYGQNPYGQQAAANPYDTGNPYAQQQSPNPYDANQYPQYGQAPGYDPNNPYAQQGAAGYGQYPPQPYGGGSYQPAYAAPTNGMAIAALILAFVFAPLGIVFGIMARNQIKQSGEAGDGMALAGIIIGGIFTAFFVLAIVFVVIVGIAATSAVSGVSGY